MDISEATAMLLSRLQQMLGQSGEYCQAIDVETWLDEWLKEPLYELGGARPVDVLSTSSGIDKVEILLERMRGGLPG